MKQLTPVKNKASYADSYQKKINEFFNEIFYKPILKIITDAVGTSYFNSMDELHDKVMKGKIQYVDGLFTGDFTMPVNKTLKSFGAKWSPSKKGWLLPQAKLPMDISSAIGVAASKFEKMHASIVSYLDDLNVEKKAKELNFIPNYTDNIGKLEMQFEENVKSAISIVPKLTAEATLNLARDYSTNLELSINSWSQDNVFKLRDKVMKNTFSGYRSENLIKDIQKNQGVSFNKAKFLARQETSLVASKFNQERFKSVGVRRYRWSTSGDSRVRDRHKHLNKRIFDWDNPPITDETTGARNHPGEDYQCRCVPIPILD